jgi:hypothetical protein
MWDILSVILAPLAELIAGVLGFDSRLTTRWLMGGCGLIVVLLACGMFLFLCFGR